MAVSGGPDSLALLLLAHAAMPGAIEAATVDHGLRAESAGEAETVGEACREFGVPHVILPVEVKPGNLQANARAARYEALSGWANARGLDALATAHHADDQAETLLMRLNRGSGVAGLAGVRARGEAAEGGPPLLRPLLGWRKTELEAIAARSRFAPVRDPTNESLAFDRSRIRAALAQAEWLDPLAIARSAALLAEAQQAISQLADEEFLDRAFDEGDGYRYHPAGPKVIMIEVVLGILKQMGSVARRSEVARLVERLMAGEPASLGGVLVRPKQWRDPDEPVTELVWRFEPEPPRSVH